MKKKNKLNEGVFDAAKRFSDAFFDGLKMNATNKALEKAKKSKDYHLTLTFDFCCIFLYSSDSFFFNSTSLLK